jgi:hypothetical protein
MPTATGNIAQEQLISQHIDGESGSVGSSIEHNAQTGQVCTLCKELCPLSDPRCPIGEDLI